MGIRADYDPADYKPKKYSAELREILKTEFSEQFTDGMRNRMLVSNFKYGQIADGFPERCDAVDSMRVRLDRYLETGNAEWLIDVANFAMIEFMHPRKPDAHYRPTDSHESPGRSVPAGVDPHGPNIPVDRAVERLRNRRSGD